MQETPVSRHFSQLLKEKRVLHFSQVSDKLFL